MVLIQGMLFGKTSQGLSHQMAERTSTRCSKSLRRPEFQMLDLQNGRRPGWLEQMIEPFVGERSMRNIGASPKVARACSLSSILETDIPTEYYLTNKKCAEITRRAEILHQALPPEISEMLKVQAGNEL